MKSKTTNQIRKLYKDLKVGDKVRVKDSVEVFYSNYAGNPRMELTSDIEGTVGAVHVPCVRKSVKPYGEYVCVDFLSSATGRIERAAVGYDNLTKLEN